MEQGKLEARDPTDLDVLDADGTVVGVVTGFHREPGTGRKQLSVELSGTRFAEVGPQIELTGDDIDRIGETEIRLHARIGDLMEDRRGRTYPLDVDGVETIEIELVGQAPVDPDWEG